MKGLMEYDTKLKEIYGKDVNMITNEKELDEHDVLDEHDGMEDFKDCPNCRGMCEYGGGNEACDCKFCGSKLDGI